MGVFGVVGNQPGVQIILQSRNSLVEFDSESTAKEFAPDRSIDPFHKTAGLRPAQTGRAVFDFAERQSASQR